MKKLLSTSYSAGAFSTAMLLFRIAIGALMMHHGYDKLVHFDVWVGKFSEMLGSGVLGMTPKVALAMEIFAEFFCALFIIIGLFTRLAAIPLIIGMSVALFTVHHFDVFESGEKVTLYLAGFIVLLLVGPGRASVDSMIGK